MSSENEDSTANQRTNEEASVATMPVNATATTPAIHTASATLPTPSPSVEVPNTLPAIPSQPPPAQETFTSTHDPSSTSPLGESKRESKSPPAATLRRGKWTVEEEAYVARIIRDFNAGYLKAPAGTTLRSYLSDKLQCDPMRITKKFTGEESIGKRVFHPADKNVVNQEAIEQAQAELVELERRWRRRLEMQQREATKRVPPPTVPQGNSTPATPQAIAPIVTPRLGQNVVTQAASWLDRANAILKDTQPESERGGDVSSGRHAVAGGVDYESISNEELEHQMRAVQSLINEGPLVQQTTAGLPSLLSGQGSPDILEAEVESATSEPPEKRLRTSGSITSVDDADALVGFVRSVEESAAAAGEEKETEE
eukprot:Nitzschia sp. Nitz4//scaffold62_size106224//32147//33416//NITZ4_004348-RA/size106224-augustus-gene-0.88-mRNA-1//1//CDS//3329555832//3174//frame0